MMTVYRPNMAKVRTAARRNGIDPAHVKPSKNKGKKLRVFDRRKKTWTHFGHSAYSDYTIHGDEKRRLNYLRRARGMPHPRMSRNWLAMKLLWGG